MTSNVAKDMGVGIEMLNSTMSDCSSVLRNKIESRMKVCKDVGGKTEKSLNLNQAISMHGLTAQNKKLSIKKSMMLCHFRVANKTSTLAAEGSIKQQKHCLKWTTKCTNKNLHESSDPLK